MTALLKILFELLGFAFSDFALKSQTLVLIPRRYQLLEVLKKRLSKFKTRELCPKSKP